MSNRSLILKGVVSSTSNKQGEKFKVEATQARKSFYLTLNDEEKAKAIAFGLTEYTPKDKNALPYFQVKASNTIKRYNDTKANGGVIVEEFEGNAFDTNEIIGKNDKGEPIYKGTPNFTSNDKEITLSLFKGKSENNEFVRLVAIMCENDVFTENEEQHAFDI